MQTLSRSWPTGRHAKCVAISRLRSVRANASVHARWCLDVRYGCKAEATALLQEWVATVGSQAGLTAANTRLSSGWLGVPESRLEMEVSFDSMADWEAFLSAVPFQGHKAWSQRIQSMVVDGSPVWQVHRSEPLPGAASSTAAAAATAAGGAAGAAPGSRRTGAGSSSSSSGVGGGLGKLVITNEIGLDDIAAWHQQQDSNGRSTREEQQQQQQRQREQPPAVPAEESSDGSSSSSSSSDGPRDWKGDPMKLNPGDKLPFKFL